MLLAPSSFGSDCGGLGCNPLHLRPRVELRWKPALLRIIGAVSFPALAMKFGLPPAYVKPFVKRQKNDAADAEAICEASQRPTMRFVQIKSETAQAAAVVFSGP
jgi:hypothetical protein